MQLCGGNSRYYGPRSQANRIWQGLMVWRLGEGSFELQGFVSHYDPEVVPLKSSLLPPSPPSSYGRAASCPVPECSSSTSKKVLRALHIGPDALFTVSAGLVRADSLSVMRAQTTAAAAATADAIAAGLGVNATSAMWAAARAASQIASVPLAHDMCGRDSFDMYEDGVHLGNLLEKRAVSGGGSASPPQPPSPPRPQPPPPSPPCPACTCAIDDGYCEVGSPSSTIVLISTRLL